MGLKFKNRICRIGLMKQAANDESLRYWRCAFVLSEKANDELNASQNESQDVPFSHDDNEVVLITHYAHGYTNRKSS